MAVAGGRVPARDRAAPALDLDGVGGLGDAQDRVGGYVAQQFEVPWGVPPIVPVSA